MMRRFCCLLVLTISVGAALAPGRPLSGSSRGAAEPALHYLYGSGSVTGGNDISLRVSLTSPAPPGGVRVHLAATNPAIAVPGSVRVPAGASEYAFQVPSYPVASDLTVRILAKHDGVEKSRTVLVKAPRLSSLSVQSRMRAGGHGKITVRLTGPAPDAGISVDLTTNRPSLVSGPSPVVVASGRRSVTVIVSLGRVTRDVEVNVIARLNGQRLVAPSLIRDYDLPSTPTPTSTLATATQSVTATPTVTSTASLTPAPDPQTGTPTATDIASTATATGTVTSTPSGVEFQLDVVGGASEVVKGSVIEVDVCAVPEPTVPLFVSFRSSNETVVLQSDISPVSVIIEPGTAPCTRVSLTGRRDASDNLGVGVVNLIVNYNGQEFISPPVAFVHPPATATETAAATASATNQATETSTSTPFPTATYPDSFTPAASVTSDAATITPTRTETAAAVATPSVAETQPASVTPGPTDPFTIDLIGSETTFLRGSAVSIEICASAELTGTVYPTLTTSNEQIARSDDVQPGNVPMTPGECVAQAVLGRADLPQFGVGTVFLILHWNGMYLQGPEITFVWPT